MTETVLVEASALVAIILEEAGWRPLAERIAAASASTTCINVFEAALAVVREKDLTPSAAHQIVLDTAARLDVRISDYASQPIPRAISAHCGGPRGALGLRFHNIYYANCTFGSPVPGRACAAAASAPIPCLRRAGSTT